MIIAVGGGKGGVGKTFIAANLAYGLSAYRKVLLVDADVENPSTRILFRNSKSIWRRAVEEFRPRINNSKCKLCLMCVNRCPENALIHIPKKGIKLIETLCSGCGVCKLVCPSNAIESSGAISGWIELSNVKTSLDILHGELACGSRRRNTLIVETLSEALKIASNYDYLVIDLPPGTGAGIASVIRKSDMVLLVTEPTPLGFSDARKFLELTTRFSIQRIAAVINKWGIGGIEDDLVKFFSNRDIKFFKVPYSHDAVKSYIHSKPIFEIAPQSDVTRSIIEIVNFIIQGAGS